MFFDILLGIWITFAVFTLGLMVYSLLEILGVLDKLPPNDWN